MMKEKEALKILQLDIKDLNDRTLRKRYHELIAKVHPDTHGGSEDAKRRTQELNEARSCLREYLQKTEEVNKKKLERDIIFTKKERNKEAIDLREKAIKILRHERMKLIHSSNINDALFIKYKEFIIREIDFTISELEAISSKKLREMHISTIISEFEKNNSAIIDDYFDEYCNTYGIIYNYRKSFDSLEEAHFALEELRSNNEKVREIVEKEYAKLISTDNYTSISVELSYLKEELIKEVLLGKMDLSLGINLFTSEAMKLHIEYEKRVLEYQYLASKCEKYAYARKDWEDELRKVMLCIDRKVLFYNYYRNVEMILSDLEEKRTKIAEKNGKKRIKRTKASVKQDIMS